MTTRQIQMRILSAAYDRGAATAEISRAIELGKLDQVELVVLLSARGMSVRATPREMQRG